MNTRSTSDKDQIANLYKTALESEKKTKNTLDSHSTFYTSTPASSSASAPKKLDFNINEPEKIFSTKPTAPECDTDDSGDETIKPLDESKPSNFETKSHCARNTNIMAQSNPFATLKYAIEAVPFFDGQNIPLNYFIEGCEEAKSMLPPEAESQFTKILRTRIVGEARRTIRDQDFENVGAMTKYLKQIYGGTKNIYQLQGELGSVYQKNEEDVVTYANRVKLLGKQILEAYRNSGHGLPDESIRQSLEKDMCKCFIRGLKPDIEQRIARNLGVQETVADALRIERELRDISDLRHGSANVGRPKTQEYRSTETCSICFKPGHAGTDCRKNALLTNSFKQNNLGTEILICQICKKRGHSADKCWLRDPQNRRPIKLVQENVIKCQLCSKSGHNAKNCLSNNSTNSYPNKISLICQWCEKPGHTANNCWRKQNEQINSNNQNKIICQLCNNFGHIAKNCRSHLKQRPDSTTFCRYCKENGHLIENCQLRIASNNRRKENGSGNENGPSKTGVPQGSDQISRPMTAQKMS